MSGEAYVECHSGFTYAVCPRALRWQDERKSVKAVIAQWHQPDSRCFRVITEDELVFELCYQELNDVWCITPL